MFNAGPRPRSWTSWTGFASFAEAEGIRFTITMTADPETVGSEIKKIRRLNQRRRPESPAAALRCPPALTKRGNLLSYEAIARLKGR